MCDCFQASPALETSCAYQWSDISDLKGGDRQTQSASDDQVSDLLRPCPPLESANLYLGSAICAGALRLELIESPWMHFAILK